ncbi:SH3 domain-containing protein [Candidatus Chlorohelix sp.]|uniref:SH3 domain-containing protein n=1 Tax=Candidatus Chlorohelix sp. TaxID=3139201 RepID=UPI00303E4E21
MEPRQETKSLPRNRKCANCRYFEPAPLWRKGWCRNPRLYDRRANHLVDATSIDCEQVFRARIYWEPIPEPELIPSHTILGQFADNSTEGSVDGGGKPRVVSTEGVLRPKAPIRPVISRTQRNAPGREKTEALPDMVKQPNQLRRWMLANIPYYDKVDGPFSRVPWAIILPGLVILLALLIIFANIFGGSKKQEAVSATPAAVVTSLGATSAVSLTTTSSNNNNAVATPTLSNALPTASPLPVTTTVVSGEKRAKVVNTGTSKSVNLRKDTSTKDDKNIIARIPEGSEVVIIGAPQFAEGKEWWQIKYKEFTGWAAKDYLQPIP